MQLDKIEHIQAGAAIAGAAKGLGANDSQALALSAIAGAAKEAWDATGRGTPEPWDFVATALGGLLILALLGPPTSKESLQVHPEPRPSAGLSLSGAP